VNEALRTATTVVENCSVVIMLRLPYTVKTIRISMNIFRRVFHILTEPIPYKFVSINRRNNEAPAQSAMWARALLSRRFKAAYHDTDIVADILARIVARISARLATSLFSLPQE